jgi:hypothetical protein
MQALLKRVVQGIREDFGQPVSLRRALAAHPRLRASLDVPKPCIDAASVPRWHELGVHAPSGLPRRERGFLLGWHFSAGRWQSFHLVRPEYAQLAHCQVELNWCCDVTDIDGFAASKAELRCFSSIDAMAEARCQWLISEVASERLAKSLAHKEIRIIHDQATSDHFARYLWDGRLWLVNAGGSHHTAAAKYLSARLGQPVPLVGKCHTYSLNARAIADLRRDFEMFAISEEDMEGFGAFSEAMCALRATWLHHPLPRPYEVAMAVLLPRSEARSMRAAAELRAAGIADLGAHLAALCARQQ